MAGTLILVRHGESEWNLKNLFTGWKNPELTDKGIEEARATGRKLKAAGLAPTVFFTSALKRAQHSLDLILDELGIVNCVITRNQALNERDYGDLAGLNKDDARERWGEEQVLQWRRSYDVPPPGGESLKDTAARTLPYSDRHILPAVRDGKTVLVSAHGNSLRSMVMAIEQLTPEQIVKRELATGEPVVYRIGKSGKLKERVAL
jgi:2,3-bisphosphoglycerate-dependent phosphoglycerate mutase